MKRRLAKGALSIAGVLACSLSLSVAASAAPEGKPAEVSAIDRARTQFRQGLALETAGDWAGALSLFQQVASVKLTPQVRFHIGLCEEHLGRLAAALGDYEIAAHEADEAKVAEVSAQVAARRDELQARIPKLTLVRGSGAEYASLSIDGVSLGSASIGVKLPLDPGPHTVEARATGFKPFSVSFEVAEKESKQVEVKLERLPVAPPSADASATASAAPAERATRAASGTNVLPFVVGGAGVASLGASTIFFVLRQNAISTLNSQCVLPPGNSCPPEAQSTYDNGKTYTVLADVTLGLGIVGVGLGTVLWFTQKKSPSAPAVGLAPMAARGSVGATVSGSF
ncbi:MAG TPA: hypothetical protein VF881_16335 [Polyangiaceae bacterium]